MPVRIMAWIRSDRFLPSNIDSLLAGLPEALHDLELVSRTRRVILSRTRLGFEESALLRENLLRTYQKFQAPFEQGHISLPSFNIRTQTASPILHPLLPLMLLLLLLLLMEPRGDRRCR